MEIFSLKNPKNLPKPIKQNLSSSDNIIKKKEWPYFLKSKARMPKTKFKEE